MTELFATSTETYLRGNLTFIPEFLSPTDADLLYRELIEHLHWRQESLTIYGREHPSPRLQTWLGSEHIPYTYSGKTFVSELWPDSIKELALNISNSVNVDFNSVLANLYRNGQDSMGWHADDEPDLGSRAIIASLSLGTSRDFALRERGATRQHSKITLPHGSLLIMHAGMQQDWQHSVPKRQGVTTPRINLTFRQILKTV